MSNTENPSTAGRVHYAGGDCQSFEAFWAELARAEPTIGMIYLYLDGKLPPELAATVPAVPEASRQILLALRTFAHELMHVSAQAGFEMGMQRASASKVH